MQDQMNSGKTAIPKAQTQGITLNTTLLSNNSLEYATFITYTTNDEQEVPGNYKVTTRQNITNVATNTLHIDEFIDVNTTISDYSLIRNKLYSYFVNSSTNIPFNTSSYFPSIFSGGWQHNFPTVSDGLTLNNQEISYAFRIARSTTLTYQADEDRVYDQITISTKKFTSTMAFQVTCSGK